MSQLQTFNIDAETAHIVWPDVGVRDRFIAALQTELPRTELSIIEGWVRVLGKPSQFLGHKIWSMEECITHFRELELYELREAELKAQAAAPPKVLRKRGRKPKSEQGIEPAESEPKPAPVEPVKEPEPPAQPTGPTALDVASQEWHDAVAQRKEAIDSSRNWTKAEVERLRAAHVLLEHRWFQYVEHKRKAMQNLR